MTVSTTHVKNTFTGNGSQQTFNFTFQTLKTTDIKVTLGGIDQPSGFTVSLNADQEVTPGGNVLFVAAPGNGVAGEILRSTPLTQEAGFTYESLLSTNKLELVIDKLTLLLQEAKASTQGQTGAQGPTGPQGPSGDVGGPVTSTNNALAVWDGTGGNLLKNGPTGSEGNILKWISGAWTAAAAAASIPSGAIMLWDTNMAAIPTGWAAMDGQSVTINGVSKTTIDTRGKYVLAAAENDSGSSGYTGSTVRPGTVAGTKNHTHANGGTITVGQTTAGGSIVASGTPVQFGGSATATVNGSATFFGSSHNHLADIGGNTQGMTDANRPIECAFLLIIKVDE